MVDLFFNDLHESDIFDLSSEIHKEALWICFADFLEMKLERMKYYWNTQRIRRYGHAAVAASSGVMYFLLEEYGVSDCLYQVSSQKLVEMKNRVEDEQEIDSI